ncbi:MAG: hypothetical protein ACO3C1_07750 [Ilumatobacteraceae bacterium]
MTRRRNLTTVGVLATTTALLTSVFSGPTADATVSLKNSVLTCSVTSALPSVNTTKQLGGYSTVDCTASMSTSVTVTVQVVELDGTIIDQLGGAFFTSSSKALTKGLKTSWKVNTPVATCPNADPEGKEDFYTVATISGGGQTVSERLGKLDYWSC